MPAERIGAIIDRNVQSFPKHYGGGVVERHEDLGRRKVLTIPYGPLSLDVVSERRPESGIMVPTIRVNQTIDPRDSAPVATILAQEEMRFSPQYDFFIQPGGDHSAREHVGIGGGHRVELALAQRLSRGANLMDPYDASGSWVSPQLIEYIASLSSSYGRMLRATSALR